MIWKQGRGLIFLLLSVAIAIAVGLFVYFNYRFSTAAYFEEFGEQRHTYGQILNAQLDNSTSNLLLVATLFASSPEVQELFRRGKEAVEAEGGGPGGAVAARIRQRLYQAVAPEWTKAMENFDTRQLHLRGEFGPL